MRGRPPPTNTAVLIPAQNCILEIAALNIMKLKRQSLRIPDDAAGLPEMHRRRRDVTRSQDIACWIHFRDGNSYVKI